MKILVITDSAWDDTNSTGNTMSNLFSEWNKDEIANLYFREAMPQNDICKYYFSVSGVGLIKSLFYKSAPGNFFIWRKDKEPSLYENYEGPYLDKPGFEEKLYAYFRNKRSYVALWGQDCLWRLGTWRNEKLDNFLLEYQPHIIFVPSLGKKYIHNVLWHIQAKTKGKVALFHTDDYLNNNMYSAGYFEKIFLKSRAKTVAHSACKADINYCISQKQKVEYEKKLGIKMKLLYKGRDFSLRPPYTPCYKRDFIRIIYVGSILYGRWKTLSHLAKAMEDINENSGKKVFELLIYSQYNPDKNIRSQIERGFSSKFKGKISAGKVPEVLRGADIVLHVESFEKKEQLATRLSFSTKIVDCLHSGRSVMAIGWKEAASIEYLFENDAALIASSEDEITNLLRKIAENTSLLTEYADKAWECGRKNHQINEIQKSLCEDFKLLMHRG